MRDLIWKIRAKGWSLISAFVSREGRRSDRIFAEVEKDGVTYTFDGRELVENSGINGEIVDIDRINLDRIDELSPDSRHIILLNSFGVRIIVPKSIGEVKVIEMTLEGKVLREYEMEIGGL